MLEINSVAKTERKTTESHLQTGQIVFLFLNESPPVLTHSGYLAHCQRVATSGFSWLRISHCVVVNVRQLASSYAMHADADENNVAPLVQVERLPSSRSQDATRVCLFKMHKDSKDTFEAKLACQAEKLKALAAGQATVLEALQRIQAWCIPSFRIRQMAWKWQSLCARSPSRASLNGRKNGTHCPELEATQMFRASLHFLRASPALKCLQVSGMASGQESKQTCGHGDFPVSPEWQGGCSFLRCCFGV